MFRVEYYFGSYIASSVAAVVPRVGHGESPDEFYITSEVDAEHRYPAVLRPAPLDPGRVRGINNKHWDK